MATNNDTLTITPPNPHLSLRIFESIPPVTSTVPSAKPFAFQSKLLHKNSAVLSLQVGKVNAAKNLSESHESLFPNDFSASVVTSAAVVDGGALSMKAK